VCGHFRVGFENFALLYVKCTYKFLRGAFHVLVLWCLFWLYVVFVIVFLRRSVLMAGIMVCVLCREMSFLRWD
jgi:hypothetical protein